MFLSNDILATQCLAYALSQGYRIPDDIRIMGYDGIYITSLVYPALTTVQQNFTKLAECAVDTAINLIEGKETPKEILIPVELIEAGKPRKNVWSHSRTLNEGRRSHAEMRRSHEKKVSNKIMLITYADCMGNNLHDLDFVLTKYLKDAVYGLHILPFFPFFGRQRICTHYL